MTARQRASGKRSVGPVFRSPAIVVWFAQFGAPIVWPYADARMRSVKRSMWPCWQR